MNSITIPLPTRHQVIKFCIVAVILAIVLYIGYVVREIWIPLLLALVIATVLDPVVDRMEARGWKRGPASAFIFGSFILVLGGLLWLAIPTIAHEIQTIQEGFNKFFPDHSQKGLHASLKKMDVPEAIRNAVVPAYVSFEKGITKSSGWITDYGMRFLSNMIWIALVPIIAFYTLKDFHLMLAKGLLLVPSKRRDLVQTFVAEMTGVFAKYLRGLAIVSVMNGVATTILLFILRVPSAVLLGVIAGVLYSVPYVGAILTVVITAAVAFITGGVQYMLLVTACSWLLHHLVFDQIVSPRVVGGQVGLHPIISIIALLIGNILLGVIGMILAVPIAACIQIAILAIAPKLRHEIFPEDPEGHPEEAAEAAALSEEAKLKQIQTEETHTLHQTVVQAVDNIEEKVKQSDPL